MRTVSPGADEQAAVEAHLRRLDTPALAAFVADLWAARGYETERDGTAVRATRTGEDLLVRVGGESATDATADIVVAPSGVDSEGATVFDAADLAEQVWYAVDRPVARELCERHLGAVPADLSPPAGYLAQRWLPGGFSPTVSLVLVVVLLAVVGFGAVLGAGVLSGGASETTPTSADPTATAAQPQRAPELRAVSLAANRLPPGVTSDGISDLEALATAHAESLANRSYTVELDRHLFDIRNQEVVDIHRDIDINVSGDRYLVSVDQIVEDRRTPRMMLYHDGTNTYVARWDDGSVTYDKLSSVEENRTFTPNPERITERVVRTRLSTPSTQIQGVVERADSRLIRVAGGGEPEWPGVGDVRGYNVTALVTSEGFVREMTAEYTAPSGLSLVDVRRELRYSHVGEVSVSPPEWFSSFEAEPPASRSESFRPVGSAKRVGRGGSRHIPTQMTGLSLSDSRIIKYRWDNI